MENNILKLKQRFNIVGNSHLFIRALNKALRVANTDISILVTGESGTGKDIIPKIIHENSMRKHGKFIAVNCGAIPEGTIDSELFGHEKGAFTGAINSRSGYFEVANNGTIFLDEIGDLPLQTQVRLLRVLENGEFIKVGSSKVEKTNVRIIAATNLNLLESVKKNKFREDLYYRINTVEIEMPPLRSRKEDIHLMFRKFASDFSDKNKIPPVKLTEKAIAIIENHNWPGNIRQLKNFTEKLSIIEEKRLLSETDVSFHFKPNKASASLITRNDDEKAQFSEREILYKILFDLKNDLNDLKQITQDLIQEKAGNDNFHVNHAERIQRVFDQNNPLEIRKIEEKKSEIITQDIIEENLSLQDNEYEIIQKALEKNEGKRKKAAKALGISERTLYRKIKQYDL
ncbi:MAG: sigma-54-dependent Fis family transcriptional regulator [Flavobacteriales bacterium]|nr:sigma-54-dependent Fis family transcriptional regulator [Flavobacteriales bacterium]|tara:strand:+ start:1601 stop:2803 length:1203 start_codon:yes stop_codon:yes gene_type:complete